MTKFLCNFIPFRLCLESFKLDMINLVYEVIRRQNKCSYVEIFDKQSNSNFTISWIGFFITRAKFLCNDT